MPTYNFLNLSPLEFEDVSRDLLQKHLKLTFESFTSGRDNGIDLRYSKGASNIIVQCKRYDDFNNLYSNLKKEVEKVKLLGPQRYIITTSAPLTPLTKAKIRSLFEPYILNYEDIYGPDDLNNLLGIHLDVEKKHFKLWLASTNILERLINSRVHNQSSFEEEKIEEAAKVFVENESYQKAIEILKDKKYIIISGLPGIGKSTLARILICHFLAQEDAEFYFLSDSINDAFSLYKEDTRQAFFFDDFLGKNFLENKLSTNEEQRIVNFMEKVRKSSNKIFVLTTREYILAQAKLQFEVLDGPTIEFAKCIIELEQYTLLVRARILYNHLFFCKVSQEYLLNILENENYLKIINHKNYNPRTISMVTRHDVREGIPPSDFTKEILSYLNDPQKIWRQIYESQISKLSQSILSVLMTTGTPILMDNLKNAVNSFCNIHSKKYGIQYSPIEFKKSLKELENSFILIKKDSKNVLGIEFKNPSIHDFLISYYSDDQDAIQDLIETSIYLNQINRIFAIHSFIIINGKETRRNKIVLNNSAQNKLAEKLINNFDTLENSIVEWSPYILRTYYWKEKMLTPYMKLDSINGELAQANEGLKDFIKERFINIAMPNDLAYNDFPIYLNLLKSFKDEIPFDAHNIIDIYWKQMPSLDNVYDFENFKEIYPLEYQSFIGTEKFSEELFNLASEYADESSDEHLEDALSNIEDIERRFNEDFYDLRRHVTERINSIIPDDVPEENFYDDYKFVQGGDDQIRDMFKSLID